MGFHVYKRTDYDEQGNPYPLLYMRWNGIFDDREGGRQEYATAGDRKANIEKIH